MNENPKVEIVSHKNVRLCSKIISETIGNYVVVVVIVVAASVLVVSVVAKFCSAVVIFSLAMREVTRLNPCPVKDDSKDHYVQARKDRMLKIPGEGQNRGRNRAIGATKHFMFQMTTLNCHGTRMERASIVLSLTILL